MSSSPSTTVVDAGTFISVPIAAAPSEKWLGKKATFQTYAEAVLAQFGLRKGTDLDRVLRDRGAQTFQDRYPNWKR